MVKAIKALPPDVLCRPIIELGLGEELLKSFIARILKNNGECSEKDNHAMARLRRSIGPKELAKYRATLTFADAADAVLEWEKNHPHTTRRNQPTSICVVKKHLATLGILRLATLGVLT